MSDSILTTGQSIEPKLIAEADMARIARLMGVWKTIDDDENADGLDDEAILAFQLYQHTLALQSALAAAEKQRDEYLELLRLAREPVKLIACGGNRRRADLEDAEYLYVKLTMLFKEPT